MSGLPYHCRELLDADILRQKLDRIERRLAVLESPGQMPSMQNVVQHASAPQWQPIETAPKDGTSVLVCRVNTKPEAAVQPIRTDWWSNHYEQWMKSNAYSQPTHWMPLPPPPREAGKP